MSAQLTQRYLYPHMQPPNQTVLEAERDELTAKYDEVALHLEELDQTTEAIRQGLDEHQTAIQQSVAGVNEMIEQVRTREEQREKDFEKVKAEVEEMREEFTSMLNRSRKSQISALTDLQGELKSLRSLLVSRGGLAAQPATSSSENANEGEKAPPAPRAAPLRMTRPNSPEANSRALFATSPSPSPSSREGACPAPTLSCIGPNRRCRPASPTEGGGRVMLAGSRDAVYCTMSKNDRALWTVVPPSRKRVPGQVGCEGTPLPEGAPLSSAMLRASS